MEDLILEKLNLIIVQNYFIGAFVGIIAGYVFGRFGKIR